MGDFEQEAIMAKAATKLKVTTEEAEPAERPGALSAQRPLQSLRRGLDQFLEDFDLDFRRSPFRRSLFDIDVPWRRAALLSVSPAFDVAEHDDAYEVTADLPRIDEKNIDVKIVDDRLVIKGETQEEKEEKNKNYHLRERSFGSFERSFPIPEGVDTDKIEANFKAGVLTVKLPKKPEAQKPAKTIDIKGA
jgi:HSP20 family protein